MTEEIRLGKGWSSFLGMGTSPGALEAEKQVLSKSPQAAYKYEDILVNGSWEFKRVGEDHYSIELATTYNVNRRVATTGTAINLDLPLPFSHEWKQVEFSRTLTTGGIDQGLMSVYIYPILAEGYIGSMRFQRSFEGRIYGIKTYVVTMNAQATDFITPSFVVRRLG